MDLSKLVWGFNPSSNTLLGKSLYTGLTKKRIPIFLSTSQIIDVVATSEKFFMLQYSTLNSIHLVKNTQKAHDLILNTYTGLVLIKNTIIILAEKSLKFTIKTKLCRKANISIRGYNIISKTSNKDHAYFLVNREDKTLNTVFIDYSLLLDSTQIIELKIRLKSLTSTCSSYSHNTVYIFGGRYESGWSSTEFWTFNIENMAFTEFGGPIKPGLFNLTGVYTGKKIIGAMDRSGALHTFSIKQNKWRLYSDTRWDKRKALILAWKSSQTIKNISHLHRLPLSLFQYLVKSFL
ncbi:hypothetical protein SteCoe_22351 [Stentor coeruleus]|uniref:Uncharacterized protein n=1 Tax=Stentor coeruleus TaxID=5963 RepID=A0A1R2BME0_9CILI|nr:hypothetical protein SteCoe_22351 [Stentor coeruleus]